MTVKNNMNENAKEIIYKNLDIITYIRNMMLLDIIDMTIIEEDKKDIINFLCRPIISVNKNKKNQFDEFYKVYKEQDFEKFVNNIKELVQKPNKDIKDKKLISISKEHLEQFV